MLTSILKSVLYILIWYLINLQPANAASLFCDLVLQHADVMHWMKCNAVISVCSNCVTCSGEHHLGCTEPEMIGRSWYEFLHPDDLRQAADEHRRGEIRAIPAMDVVDLICCGICTRCKTIDERLSEFSWQISHYHRTTGCKVENHIILHPKRFGEQLL
jgi:hypothetical protein